jgi:hypothetical protein
MPEQFDNARSELDGDRAFLIFLPDKPQRLMRGAQCVPLLETHGE